jgi:hypothetical protein
MRSAWSLGAELASIHSTVPFSWCALGDEVVDVVRPTFWMVVATFEPGSARTLDDRHVERLSPRRSAPCSPRCSGPWRPVDDDQRPLELAGVLAVDPEVGLQRKRDLDALGDVDE